MYSFAMVMLPDAFVGSIGAMIDSYALIRDRLRHIVVDPAKPEPNMSLTVLSSDGLPVRTVGDVACKVDRAIASRDQFDLVWLPSFRTEDVEAVRAWLSGSRELIGWLEDRAAAGTTIAASGAAATLLLEARLLDGRPLPASRVFLPFLRALYPRCLADDRLGLADYGNILLSSGTGHDLAVIAQAASRTISAYTGRWLAEVTAFGATKPGHLAKDPLVARAQLWIEQAYATDLTVADLARRLSTSPPTLTRRFRNALGVTPKTYAQQLRLAAAQGMLAGTTRPIEEIARFVGYSDVRIFRDAFRRQTGETASAWRRERLANERKPPKDVD